MKLHRPGRLYALAVCLVIWFCAAIVAVPPVFAQDPQPQPGQVQQPPPQKKQRPGTPFETVPLTTEPAKPETPAAKPAAAAPQDATVQGPIPEIVESVEFRGSRRVPQDTLRALIFTKKGDRFEPETLNRDFMALWNTGRFDDIKLEKEPGKTGYILRFVVTERRVIRTIKYEGNKSITLSEILDRYKERKVGLQVESQYDPNKVQRARNVLLEYLAERGRQFAKVEPQIRQIPPSSMELDFVINEGPKVKVGEIIVKNNHVFTSKAIRQAMKNLKPIGIPYSIFFEEIWPKTYDSTKLDEDMDRVRVMMQQKGYFTARVVDHKTQVVDTTPHGHMRIPLLYSPKPGKAADITLTIEEGKLFYLNKVNFTGVKLFKTPEVLMAPLFGMREGDVFSTAKIEKGLKSLQKLYGEFGYINMVAEPDPNPDIPNAKMDFTLSIDEGKQFFVRRIDFAGNTTTRDKVIRRELLIDEGDMFNQRFWELSILRLNQLGYFEVLKENESYDLRQDTKNNTVDITLKVKERGKNSVQLNGGVSGIAGSFIGFSYSTNNFLGLGETLSLNSQLGDRMRDATFSFTEPYLFDKPIQAGFTVFVNRFNYNQGREVSLTSGQNLIAAYNALGTQNLLNYVSNGRGFTVFASTLLRRSFARVGISYGYSIQNIQTLTAAATTYFDFSPYQQLNGPSSLNGIRTSSVTPSYTYNTVNHPITPTQGRSVFASLAFAGSVLGGGVNTIQPQLDMKYFRKGFKRGHVIGMHFLGRYITGYGGKTAPPFNRFYMGGENDIRGFQSWQITPFAYLPTEGSATVFNNDGSQRTIIVLNPDGTKSRVPVSMNIPAYQFISPGADTQGVGNIEYRIPIFGPVWLAGFFDAGINKLTRPEDLRLNDARLLLLNQTFPEAGFDSHAKIVAGSQAPRTSTGLELQVMMPVVNAPFRLYWAYNPNIFKDTIQPPYATDRAYFPNNATFQGALATFGTPFFYEEKRSSFRFSIGRTF
jgi:outer membrane protein insertion porin family